MSDADCTPCREPHSVAASYVLHLQSTLKNQRFYKRYFDHYFRIVSVCLFVCLIVQSFSQPSLIRFRSN